MHKKTCILVQDDKEARVDQNRPLIIHTCVDLPHAPCDACDDAEAVVKVHIKVEAPSPLSEAQKVVRELKQMKQRK